MENHYAIKQEEKNILKNLNVKIESELQEGGYWRIVVYDNDLKLYSKKINKGSIYYLKEQLPFALMILYRNLTQHIIKNVYK